MSHIRTNFNPVQLVTHIINTHYEHHIQKTQPERTETHATGTKPFFNLGDSTHPNLLAQEIHEAEGMNQQSTENNSTPPNLHEELETPTNSNHALERPHPPRSSSFLGQIKHTEVET
ncbi:hypothetical protein JTB14_016185 [Gonioctena quinquepunctata]|nr:hypothetical protein JTB14_016185 [Gonioctena quinquepunctata]